MQERLVAWAVVLTGCDHTQPHFPVSWGGVPGQCQTVVSAELTAFLSTLLLGRQQTAKFGGTSISGVTVSSSSSAPEPCKQAISVFRSPYQTMICGRWCKVGYPLRHNANYTISNPTSIQMLKNGFNGNDAADQAASHALESLIIANTHYNCRLKQLHRSSNQVHIHMVRVAQFSVASTDPQRSAPVRPQDHLSTVDLYAVATAEAG